ncbi:MAG: hypothetical protein HUU10_14175 [Bacteroidetes bacterium]|nr:hypothetical protein [Bacteroidota bacterium]
MHKPLFFLTLFLVFSSCENRNRIVDEKLDAKFYGFSLYTGEGSVELFYFVMVRDSVRIANYQYYTSYFDFKNIYNDKYTDSIYSDLLEDVNFGDTLVVPIRNVKKTRKLIDLSADSSKIDFLQSRRTSGNTRYSNSLVDYQSDKIKIVGHISENVFHGSLTIKDTSNDSVIMVYPVIIEPLPE